MLSDETYLKILKENRSLQGRILKENISEEDNPRLERYLEDVQNEAILPHVTADFAGDRLIMSFSKGAQGVVGLMALAGAGLIHHESGTFHIFHFRGG